MATALAVFQCLTAVCFLKEILAHPFTRAWRWNECVQLAHELAEEEVRALALYAGDAEANK